MKNLTLTNRVGNTYTMNRKKSLDRFLINKCNDSEVRLDNNNQIIIDINKISIRLFDYAYDAYYASGHKYKEFYTKRAMIDSLNAYIDKVHSC